MRERFLGAPSLLGAVACLAMVVGCEVGRVPELAPEGGVDSPTAGSSGTGGSGGAGGVGGQSVPNPCHIDRGGCSPLVECTNDDGEAVCGDCPEGTEGDGQTCTDIDECAEGLDDCDDDPPAECINRGFGYECHCPTGTRDLETMGRNCEIPSGGTGGTNGGSGGTNGGTGGNEPRNECELGEDDCDDDPEATCTDTLAGYSCECPEGYEDPDTGARNCEDIDECEAGIDACDTDPVAECDNTEGGYTCDCPEGYMEAANGHDCEDFDECSLGTDDCDDDPDACVDGDGAFSCECPEGYDDVNNDGTVCEDLNECEAGTDLCDPEATCMDEEGGYRCECPGGVAEDVLGDGHFCTAPDTRVGMGNSHTCVIDIGGDVKCWGQGFNGQLGLGTQHSRGATPGQTGDFFTAADLDGRAIAIAAGCNHTCALIENGDVKCWGLNHRGQLGVGDTANRGDGPNEMGVDLERVPLSMPAIAITSGCEHSCAVLENNTVICWGAHEWSQIGTGANPGTQQAPLATWNYGDAPDEIEGRAAIDLGAGTVKRVRAGFRFTCAQMVDDTLKCWGRNNNGQLGKNDNNHRGDAAGEMGANLTAINLGTGRTVRDFAPGYIHVCARLDNNNVKCWGSGGLTDVLQEGAPCPRAPTPENPNPLPFFRVFGSIGYGDGHDEAQQCTDLGVNRGDMYEQRNERDAMNNEMGDTLPVVPMPGAPRSMAAGHHTCMTFADGSVRCFGINRSGQLGVGNMESIGDEPGEMGLSLAAIALGIDADVIAVFIGQEDTLSVARTCALFETGQLKCWGSNNIGSLGIGDQLTRGDGPDEMGTNLPVSFDLW